MSSLKNKQTTRTLESFKATAAALNVRDQVRAITGGALDGCHKPVASHG